MDKAIIYRGPSLIDQSPIVVIATYSDRNTKTGGMVQTYILADNGKSPIENNRTGGDFSICGNCKHRGKANPDATQGLAKERSCYVNLGQGVRVVWEAYKRGVYPMATHRAAEIGEGRMVRLGTYGDPAAVPYAVWERLLVWSKGWTGYTHQNGLIDIRPDLCMISADTEAEAREAWAQGKRTFRIVKSYSDLVKGREIPCPADTKGIQCAACGLCKGTSSAGKSIAITAHGPGKKYAV